MSVLMLAIEDGCFCYVHVEGTQGLYNHAQDTGVLLSIGLGTATNGDLGVLPQ